MNIIFYSLSSCFFRCLEKWTDINIKAHVRISSRNNFSSTVMTVLTHFCH